MQAQAFASVKMRLGETPEVYRFGPDYSDCPCLTAFAVEFGCLTAINWLVLSDEQMSKGWPFSLLNDEQMSNWLGVEHQPVNIW